MTQEEKAKRYDEVLEELRGLLEGIHEEKCEIMEEDITSIFPELKESSDERVRKVLIDYFKKYKEQEECGIKTFYGIPADDILAWIEKQGGKDKLIRELGEYKVKYTQEVLEKHLRTMNKDDERLRKTTIAFLKDFAKQGYENAVECIDWLEKQSEQKPQGKAALEAINEEKVDNANKDEIEIPFGAKDSELQEATYYIPKGFYAEIDDDKVIIKKGEKPTWSEEDEAMWAEISNLLWEGYKQSGSKFSWDDIRNWVNPKLKSLKERVQPQNKCKKSLTTADLENSLCDIQDGFSDTSYEYRILGKAIEFIRCTEPKPQWKPSDAQMDALEYHLKHTNENSRLYKETKKLYEQLKKLK